MSRRLGAWWMAGVALPLVLAGLVFMHTVDVGAADVPAGHEEPATVGAVTVVEMHGEQPQGCDDCRHVGLHVTTVCVAVLGSIAVWRVARRLMGTSGTTPATAAASTVSGYPEPPPLLVRGRPAWVELGVMLC
jgi:hypothetical protein